MEAQNFPPVPGRNIVAEWTGTDFPDEVVLVSGHLDSWDVGQGAMDDGGGAVISWMALSAMVRGGFLYGLRMRCYQRWLYQLSFVNLAPAWPAAAADAAGGHVVLRGVWRRRLAAVL